MTLDYFYGQAGELFSFFRIPKALFQEQRFQDLSTDAKTLYGILLDRMSLSVKNEWFDKKGRVFIIFTIEDVKRTLRCADNKATRLLRELEKFGLIERKRRGQGKSFNIMISTTKLSARTVLRAVKAAFRLYQSKASQGKQSVRTLLRQNRGVSSVEISKTGIRGLERYAKKYGIDYAIRKDTSEVPPRYLVFFKAPDAEAFHSAFKEYSASLLNKDKRPSVLAKLHELVQAAAELPGKVRHKEQERGL